MKLRTQLFFGYTIIFIFIIGLAFVTYRSIALSNQSSSWVSFTHEVISKGRLIEKSLVDMETGERGFLITGKEEFLKSYKDGITVYKSVISELKESVSHNRGQVRYLEEIEILVDKWQKTVLEPVITRRRAINRSSDSMEAVSAIVSSGAGKRVLDEIRDKVTAFIDVEKELLAIRISDSKKVTARSFLMIKLGSVFAIFAGILAMYVVIQKLTARINGLVSYAKQIKNREFTTRQKKEVADELSAVDMALNNISVMLADYMSENENQNWNKTGQNELNESMRGDLGILELTDKVITFLTTYLKAQIGAVYIHEPGSEILTLSGSYAFTKRKGLNEKFGFKEGLIGQAAFEKKMISLTNLPDDYSPIRSASGEATPVNVVVCPVLYNSTVMGVIEIGSFSEFTELQLSFLEQVSEDIAIAINSAQARDSLSINLELRQQQSEELEAVNEELRKRTEALLESEGELKAQHEELAVINEELEEKTHFLEEQKEEISRKNEELESARQILEAKAGELEITSKYKSEFLANMSHELRTPLNSILILSQQLSKNKNQTMDDKQVESADIINSCGNNLLNLINEILDLSKIEAGKMILNIESIAVDDISGSIKTGFTHVADEKDLTLDVHTAPEMPSFIQTDRQRLEQIIRNLISNAIKFTESGKITVDFHQPDKNADLSRSALDPAHAVAISVKDTGIGIPQDQQMQIFEAFQQVDGTTSRKFGGTGLGLSISRELAKLLEGEIQMHSTAGKGSVFTLYIPEILAASRAEKSKTKADPYQQVEFHKTKPAITSASHLTPAAAIADDRELLKKGDRVILLIEDDIHFARALYEFCHEKTFKCIHAADGETGLEMAGRYLPDAIILDIRLPGIEGWGVLEALKDDSKTRHIPVHIMSVDDESIDALKKGAIGYLTKPVSQQQLDESFNRIENLISKKLKDLLIVEDDRVLRDNIVALIGNGDVKITTVGTGKNALTELTTRNYDCVILDLILPDMSGLEILKKLDNTEGITIPPIIVNTAKDLSREDEYELQKYANSIIIKGVKSQERLLDETALFLHRMVDNLPILKRRMISNLHNKEMQFEGKKVILADDDMQNVFALSQVLEEKGIEVLKAANGKMALEILATEKDVDLVLMDIMMPVMDGYEAMEKIREQEQYWKLPILALTAKAMKDDRDKCIAFGANDYLPKPIEINRLLSLLRVWMYK